MLFGLLFGQASLAEQLLDQRVVLGDALEFALAQAVGAAVADVREEHIAGADKGRRQRGAHARAPRVALREGVDLGVGLAHRERQPLARPVAVLARKLAGELPHGQLRGDLAGLGTPHSVGHDEDRRTLEMRVLVGRTLVPGVGAGDVLGDADHHSSS